MKIVRETLEMNWAAPLEGELPTAILFGAVITILHGSRMIPWDSVRSRLKETIGGHPKEKKVWRGIEMTWTSGKIPVKVRVNRNQIKIRALRRVTPTKLKRLLRAFTNLPGVGPVHLKAQVEKFVDHDYEGPRAPRVTQSRRAEWMNTAQRFDRND